MSRILSARSALLRAVEALNESEVRWIEAQLVDAAKFVAAFSPADAGGPVTLAALDRAWAAWISSEPRGGSGGKSISLKSSYERIAEDVRRIASEWERER